MKLGYNTNGLAFHRFPDVIEILAEAGYRSVAISVDHHCLNPFADNLAEQLEQAREWLDRFSFASVIETGARFLLNPRVKHEPTLLSASPEERNVRIDFLKRCVDIAVALDSEAVSFWSGVLREPIDEDAAFSRLAQGCREVSDYAAAKNMKLAFEPEPGMLIETMAQYARLLEQLDAPHFGLTLDIGHLHCVEESSISDHIRQWSDRLFNIHIEDMCRGVHEHLRFGEGEIDFPPVLRTLVEIGYTGCVNVELSRHSHMAPDVLRESFAFLNGLLRDEM